MYRLAGIQTIFCKKLINFSVARTIKGQYLFNNNQKYSYFSLIQVSLFLSVEIKNKIENLPGYPALDEHFKYKLGFMRYP